MTDGSVDGDSMGVQSSSWSSGTAIARPTSAPSNDASPSRFDRLAVRLGWNGPVIQRCGGTKLPGDEDEGARAAAARWR